MRSACFFVSAVMRRASQQSRRIMQRHGVGHICLDCTVQQQVIDLIGTIGEVGTKCGKAAYWRLISVENVFTVIHGDLAGAPTSRCCSSLDHTGPSYPQAEQQHTQSHSRDTARLETISFDDCYMSAAATVAQTPKRRIGPLRKKERQLQSFSQTATLGCESM